jgi:bla regulator protein BlaR1
MIHHLTNHLWQSTLFAAAAGLLTVAFRKNWAQVRYWLWFSASLKFLVPFSLLVSLGSHLDRGPVVHEILMQRQTPAMSLQISEPFLDGALPAAPAPRTADGRGVAVLAVWLCGLGVIALMRIRGWLRIRAALRHSTPVDLPPAIEVRSAPGLLEPGVVGLLHPVLLLPAGIAERLTPLQLDAVLAHELCHIRRRDNLFAAIHMVVEAVFWFHPLVWWIGARLVEERERACDEEVLRMGGEPHMYAEGIVNVCKFYVESPLACVSGVTGSDLKKRIAGILANRAADRLSTARKILLAAAAGAVVVAPVIVGIENAPFLRAQSHAAFDVASIRPSAVWSAGGEGHGRSRVEYSPNSVTLRNVDLSDCVQWAYGARFYQMAGPGTPGGEYGWQSSLGRYDIVAKASGAVPVSQLRVMLQDLLAQRFKVTLHRETKMLPVFELVLAKGGPKLPAPKPDPPSRGNENLPRVQDGSFVFQDTTITEFAEKLSMLRGIERPVVDRTGIEGVFDITLKSAASAILQPDGPSLLTLVQEQLGLKLTAAKAPVEVLVIDHAEKPSEN